MIAVGCNTCVIFQSIFLQQSVFLSFFLSLSPYFVAPRTLRLLFDVKFTFFSSL